MINLAYSDKIKLVFQSRCIIYWNDTFGGGLAISILKQTNIVCVAKATQGIIFVWSKRFICYLPFVVGLRAI